MRGYRPLVCGTVQELKVLKHGISEWIMNVVSQGLEHLWRLITNSCCPRQDSEMTPSVTQMNIDERRGRDDCLRGAVVSRSFDVSREAIEASRYKESSFVALTSFSPNQPFLSSKFVTLTLPTPQDLSHQPSQWAESRLVRD